MRFKFTAFLFIANILLFGGLYWLNQNMDTQGNHYEPLVFPFDVMQAKRIEVKREHDAYLIEDTREGWQLKRPQEWPTNAFAMDQLLKNLQFLEKETSFKVKDVLEMGQSLAEYELNDPKYSIDIHQGGRIYSLIIGKTTPKGDRIYASDREMDEVYVLQTESIEKIMKELDHLARETLFDMDPESVQVMKIKLSQPASTQVSLKQKGKQWWFESPIEAKANSDKVGFHLSETLTLRRGPFVSELDEPSETPSFDAPSMTLSLANSKQKQTLLMSPADPAKDFVYAKLDHYPEVFTLELEQLKPFFNAQDNLRDPSILSFDSKSTSKLAIRDANKTLLLHRLEEKGSGKTSKWAYTLSDSGELSNEAEEKQVALLLEHLEKLQTKRFVHDAPSKQDLEAYGLTEPQRSIQIESPDASLELLVGRYDSKLGLVYAKERSNPSVYAIASKTLELASTNPLHYQSRILTQIPEIAWIKELKLVDLDKQQTLFEEQLPEQSTDWISYLKEHAHANWILALLSQLRQFRVRDYLKNAFEDEFEMDEETHLPWRYQIRYAFDLPQDGNHSQRKEQVLYITERLSGNFQVGGSPDAQRIFSLNQGMIDCLYKAPKPDVKSDVLTDSLASEAINTNTASEAISTESEPETPDHQTMPTQGEQDS